MGKINNQPFQKEKRQYLRNNATRSEKLLWSLLKGSQLGVKFRRQHGFGPFVVDFYCPALKLAIEIDGYTHDTDEAKAYDERRQRIIEEYGIHFLRIRDEAVHANIEMVLLSIQAEIEKLKPNGM